MVRAWLKIQGVANVAEQKKEGALATNSNSFPRPANPQRICDPDCATMRSIIPLLSLSALLVPVKSLYFYIDGTSPKCFFEELPKDTLVVGHYTAEEYNDQTKMWAKHDGLNVFISVDVCPPSSKRCLPLGRDNNC